MRYLCSSLGRFWSAGLHLNILCMGSFFNYRGCIQNFCYYVVQTLDPKRLPMGNLGREGKAGLLESKQNAPGLGFRDSLPLKMAAWNRKLEKEVGEVLRKKVEQLL